MCTEAACTEGKQPPSRSLDTAPALTLAGCVTLDKFCDLSAPRFLHLQEGEEIKVPTL